MKNTKPQKPEKKPEKQDAVLPEHISDLLRPLATFYKNAQTNPDDVHIHWEAHVVRGNGETFMSVQGSSSMPALLSRNLRGRAADLVCEELVEKITVPIHARVLEYVGELALEAAEKAVALLPEGSSTLSMDDVEEVSAKIKAQLNIGDEQ